VNRNLRYQGGLPTARFIYYLVNHSYSERYLKAAPAACGLA
jgi:hypothetical protein